MRDFCVSFGSPLLNIGFHTSGTSDMPDVLPGTYCETIPEGRQEAGPAPVGHGLGRLPYRHTECQFFFPFCFLGMRS